MTRLRGNVAAALRRRLEGECSRLAAEARRLPIDGVEQIGHGNHMADDASDVFEQAKSLALRRYLDALLAEAEEALRRFDEGTYGLCQACGQAIDPARLEALPYAPFCLRCQVQAEMRQVTAIGKG